MTKQSNPTSPNNDPICPNCGAQLFIVSSETPQDAIIRFAQSATFSRAEDIAAAGWTHPGSYCQRCGVIVLVEESRNFQIECDDWLFSIYLLDAGPHRLRVIALIREKLQLTPKEARDLVDSHHPKIFEGYRFEIDRFVKQLKDLGASIRIS